MESQRTPTDITARVLVYDDIVKENYLKLITNKTYFIRNIA